VVQSQVHGDVITHPVGTATHLVHRDRTAGRIGNHGQFLDTEPERMLGMFKIERPAVSRDVLRHDGEDRLEPFLDGALAQLVFKFCDVGIKSRGPCLQCLHAPGLCGNCFEVDADTPTHVRGAGDEFPVSSQLLARAFNANNRVACFGQAGPKGSRLLFEPRGQLLEMRVVLTDVCQLALKRRKARRQRAVSWQVFDLGGA
jgi:hypothetical protein